MSAAKRIISGKQGQIHEYSDSELGVMFMMPKTDKEPWGRWCPKIFGQLQAGGSRRWDDCPAECGLGRLPVFRPTEQGTIETGHPDRTGES